MQKLEDKNVNGISEFLDSFNTFLFDMDGVLWHGDKLLDKIPETLSMLRKMVYLLNYQLILSYKKLIQFKYDHQGKTCSIRHQQFYKIEKGVCEKV